MKGICSIAVIAILAAAQERQNPPISDSEAYAVYAVLIPQEHAVRTAQGKPVVLQQETEVFPSGMNCSGSELPSGGDLEKPDWRGAVDNYKAENATVRSVLAGKPLQVVYSVTPKANLRIRDHVFVQVSAVGFNSSKTKAIVYVASYCGAPRCASGRHHLLEKVNGVWREAKLSDVRACEWNS